MNNTHRHWPSTRHFSSAGEFLESVEDSKDSVWLVHITYQNQQGSHSPPIAFNSCKQNKMFVSQSAWRNLTRYTAQFGILAGSFNCQNDPYFCQLKGWHRPRILLGLLRHNKDYVELFTYDNCDSNQNSDIIKWIEYRLRSRLLLSSTQPNKNTESDLQIFYVKNSSDKQQLPLYFSATGLKYTRRGAKFNLVNATHFASITKCSNLNTNSLRTPLVFVLNNSVCYNYGSSLNELPNHATLNLFLTFLYPDTNCLFLVSVFFLNAYLIFLFFEYNESIVKQLLIGLFYLSIVNFCLFAVWLATMNSKLEKCLAWLRYTLLCCEFMQSLAARARFSLFYFMNVEPLWLFVTYLSLAAVYYIHTRTLAVRKKQQSENANNEQVDVAPLLEPPSEPVHRYQSVDSDTEQSVSDLISQINGLTSIWLQSSTRLDRILLELPCIQLCRCLKRCIHLAGKNSQDQYTRSMSSCSSSCYSDEDGGEKSNTDLEVHCECGQNPSLKKSAAKGVASFMKFSRECAICLERYGLGAVMVVLPCGHFFHRKCVYEWFMNSVNYKCPCCRSSLNKLKKSI
jgi:hypothetical protein